jgi:hypothetical protein
MRRLAIVPLFALLAGTVHAGDAVFVDSFEALPFPVWTPQIHPVPPSSTGNTYYVDVSTGNDARDGKSLATAFKTVTHATTVTAAGDTVLIRRGLYREPLRVGDWAGTAVGVAGKPITFGSYGDGEVILDGSAKVSGWTRYSGNVWTAPVTFTPIAIVVNEVPLKQVAQGQGGSTAPYEGLAGVVAGNAKWFYDAGAQRVYADMQSTLGSGDANAADIVVPNDVGDQQHVFFHGDWFVFDGLTMRGSGSNGIWGYGSHVTVQRCDIKFNGKAGASFQVDSGGSGSTDNAVLLSHFYQNVMTNWPRGNNGFAESGGGWAATLDFAANLRPVARGNVVHDNGGEGIDLTATMAPFPSGHGLVEQNVIHDNWSVNLYFDEQAYDVGRNNIIFNHAPDPSTYLYAGNLDPYNELDKYSVCVMLGDEENSSDATNNYANLDHTQIYNNLIAGCRIGIRDYAEGEAHAILYHGIKNTLIANNTIVLPNAVFQNSAVMGIYLSDNTTPSGVNRNVNSSIVNNVVIATSATPPLVWTELAQPIGGIALDHNVYFSPAAQPFRAGSNVQQNFALAGWKSFSANDAASQFADPMLSNLLRFVSPGLTATDYSAARPRAGSPALGAGVSQAATFTDNIELIARAVWNVGAF